MHKLLKKGHSHFSFWNIFRITSFEHFAFQSSLKTNKVYVTLCTQLLNRNLTGTGYRMSFGYQLNELLVGQGEGHHFPAFPSMQLIKLIRHPLVLPGFQFSIHPIPTRTGSSSPLGGDNVYYCTFY